ncbi:MAG: DnaJ domain-containing protein [Bosea sp. (in: a-proteobacteria)]
MGLTLLGIGGVLLLLWLGKGLLKGDPKQLAGRFRMVAGSLGLGIGLPLLASGRIAAGAIIALAGAWGLGWFDALSKTDADRGASGGREHADADAHAGQARPARPGTMSEKEAYEILGLDAGAGADAVRAAHRTLIKKLHPDAGGSGALAARVNEAKDVLMKSHR